MTTEFHAKPYDTFTKIMSILRGKKLHRIHQCSNFLRARLAIEAIKKPQSNLEENENSSILHNFSSRKVPSIGRLNGTSRVFPVLNSTNQFLLQSTVFARSDSD